MLNGGPPPHGAGAGGSVASFAWPHSGTLYFFLSLLLVMLCALFIAAITIGSIFDGLLRLHPRDTSIHPHAPPPSLLQPITPTERPTYPSVSVSRTMYSLIRPGRLWILYILHSAPDLNMMQ